MLKLPVVLAVDRAGLVGEDGETHHGIYDIGFLRHAPGMKILCPASLAEVQKMLRWAIRDQSGPVAIRYPRGGNRGYDGADWEPGQSILCHRKGTDAAILTYGVMLKNAMDAANILSMSGIEASVLRMTEVSEPDISELAARISGCSTLLIAEEVAGNCGVGSEIAAKLLKLYPKLHVITVDLGREYIQHGSVDKLYAHYGLDGEGMAKKILEVVHHEN